MPLNSGVQWNTVERTDNRTDYVLLLGDLENSTTLEGERAETVSRILNTNVRG